MVSERPTRSRKSALGALGSEIHDFERNSIRKPMALSKWPGLENLFLKLWGPKFMISKKKIKRKSMNPYKAAGSGKSALGAFGSEINDLTQGCAAQSFKKLMFS